MANNQQTAVEWFAQRIQSDKIFSFDMVLKQALQMEREQIETAYWDGGQDVPINPDRCKQYYEQTYGTNKLNKKQNERIIGNNNTF